MLLSPFDQPIVRLTPLNLKVASFEVCELQSQIIHTHYIHALVWTFKIIVQVAELILSVRAFFSRHVSIAEFLVAKLKVLFVLMTGTPIRLILTRPLLHTVWLLLLHIFLLSLRCYLPLSSINRNGWRGLHNRRRTMVAAALYWTRQKWVLLAARWFPYVYLSWDGLYCVVHNEGLLTF